MHLEPIAKKNNLPFSFLAVNVFCTKVLVSELPFLLEILSLFRNGMRIFFSSLFLYFKHLRILWFCGFFFFAPFISSLIQSVFRKPEAKNFSCRFASHKIVDSCVCVCMYVCFYFVKFEANFCQIQLIYFRFCGFRSFAFFFLLLSPFICSSIATELEYLRQHSFGK